MSRGQPIDFIFDLTKTEAYDMSGYTDASLLTLINSGRNTQINEVFRLNTFLTGIEPAGYTQGPSG